MMIVLGGNDAEWSKLGNHNFSCLMHCCYLYFDVYIDIWCDILIFHDLYIFKIFFVGSEIRFTIIFNVKVLKSLQMMSFIANIMSIPLPVSVLCFKYRDINLKF